MAKLIDQYHCCKFIFTDAIEVNQHIRSEHLLSDTNSECKKCYMKCRNIENFFAHFYVNHLGHCLNCDTCSTICINPIELHNHQNYCTGKKQGKGNKGETDKIPLGNKVEAIKQQEGEATCLLCQQKHQIEKCNSFLKRTPLQRSNMARKMDLCFKCLKEHSRATCRKPNCPRCNGTHHIVLCFQIEN